MFELLEMNLSGDNVRKKCPYMEKCYRKNPIHFGEMSHPHLEDLVKDQLVGEIEIPDTLSFECKDRELLMDQLKILQIVFRKQGKGKENDALSDTAKDSNVKVATAVLSGNDTGKDLKEKVEKHKQSTLERRINRLVEMDKTSVSANSSSNDDEEGNKVLTMRKELDSLKIEEENLEAGGSSLTKKRNCGSPSFNMFGAKKAKSEVYEKQSQKSEQSSDACQGSSKEQRASSSTKSSIMDVYTACNSMKSREEIRKKAIEKMRHQGMDVSVVEPGQFDLKYALSAPYHLFLTRIQKSKETYSQQFSITFPEILDVSLGEIVSSLQINFMVDVGWLCLQYLLAGQRTDMLILYGERVDTEKLGTNISMILVEPPTKFGCHHTKVMVLKYKDDGIRVVVSTANLYSDDWENRTQGLWISPHLPPLPSSANPSDGESPTGFKKDFERYLSRYKLAALTEWIYAVRRADFSAVNVFFVASVPGSHKGVEFDAWGHRKLGSILSKHATLPPDAPQWPIVAQSSSIGSLGPNYESWLLKDIVPTMSRETAKGLKSHPNFQFIYPSLNNYKQSFDCRVGSCCLPYSLQTHSKQEWVESYLYQWKATRTSRDRAMPHIKSYTRLSPDFKRIPWFVLTSANLSKAAWGTSRGSHYIMNYEGGVVFIPKFITNTTTFPIQEEEQAGVPVFPISYDIPLTRYESGDKPFVTEFFSGYE